MVIKETYLCPHHWINDFSYHIGSPKIHSINALNVSRHFFFQETPPSIKISHLAIRILMFLYGTIKSYREGKKVLIYY